MRYRRCCIVAMFVLLGGRCLLGCDDHAKPEGESMQTGAMLEIHTLTWIDYNGIESPEKAIYILDGESIGEGDEGFKWVLAAIDGMGPGAVLLVFPDYSNLTAGSEYPRIMPYSAYEHDLAAIATKRHVAVRLVPGPQ